MKNDYFRWMEHFEVGVPQLDADHREMHRHINDVCGACLARDHAAAAEALAALRELTLAHFEREEAVIRLIRGHDMGGHVESHRLRAVQLIEIEDRLARERSEFDLDALPPMLVDWFCKHAIGYDAKVRAYFYEDERVPRAS